MLGQWNIGLDIEKVEVEPGVWEWIGNLVLVRNKFEDLTGPEGSGPPDGIDDDGIIFEIDYSEVYETELRIGPAAITVSEYNKFGVLEFFF